jgi:predicted ester cyclase
VNKRGRTPQVDRDTAAGIARSYLESFATGDPQAIAAHVTDGFVNDHASALGSGLVGKEAYLERLPGFLASMPGLRYEPDEPIVDGSRVAAPYTLHASANDPSGTPVPITIRGVMLIDLEGELIARRLDVWDALTYLRQSGQA